MRFLRVPVWAKLRSETGSGFQSSWPGVEGIHSKRRCLTAQRVATPTGIQSLLRTSVGSASPVPLDTVISLISLIRFLFTMINDDAERKQEKFAAASCVDMGPPPLRRQIEPAIPAAKKERREKGKKLLIERR